MQQFNVASLGTLQSMNFGNSNTFDNNVDHVKGRPLLADLTAVERLPGALDMGNDASRVRWHCFLAYRRKYKIVLSVA